MVKVSGVRPRQRVQPFVLSPTKVVFILLPFCLVPLLYQFYFIAPPINNDGQNNIMISPPRSKEVLPNNQSKDVSILPLLPIDSNMGMHTLLPMLTKIIVKGNNKGRLIDFGAGVRDDDPCFPFIDAGWEGLLVDGDPSQTKKWAQRFPNKIGKDNVVSYITADTVPTLLSEHGYDSNVDLLKIDIDSFDCFVMEKVLKLVRPPVIVMEVNVKYPPHVRMAMKPGYSKESQLEFNSEKRGHVYGCSLAYQILDLMRPNDYELLHLDFNNAIYIDTRKIQLPSNFIQPIDKIYANGYWNRPTRRTAFSFNNEVEHWHRMKSDEIFLDLQKRFRSDPSHQNHHIYIGDVTVGKLTHGCFATTTGKLVKENGEADGKCTSTVTIQ